MFDVDGGLIGGTRPPAASAVQNGVWSLRSATLRLMQEKWIGAPWLPTNGAASLWLSPSTTGGLLPETELQAVTQLYDFSGNRFDFSPTTGSSGTPLVRSVSGVRVTDWPSGWHTLEAPASAYGLLRNVSKALIVIVASLDEVGALFNMSNGTGEANTRFTLSIKADGVQLGGRSVDTDAYSFYKTTQVLTLSQLYVISAEMDFAGATASIWINGGFSGSSSLGNMTLGNTSDTDSIRGALGDPPHESPVSKWAGLIGDCALFTSSNATTDSRERSEGVFAHTYGIQSDLPPAHPYKDAPPTV